MQNVASHLSCFIILKDFISTDELGGLLLHKCKYPSCFSGVKRFYYVNIVKFDSYDF